MNGDPVFVPPIGPWQEDTGTLVRCERHRNWCAYRVNDPARCSRCHTLWVVVEGRGGREAHDAEHDRDDAATVKQKAWDAAKRERVKSGAGRPPRTPDGVTPGADSRIRFPTAEDGAQ